MAAASPEGLAIFAGFTILLFVLYFVATHPTGLKSPWTTFRETPYRPEYDEKLRETPGSVFAPLGKVEPLEDFNWCTTKPRIIRPFKPKYHLTMALEMSNVSNLIQIDATYEHRIKLRENIMSQYPSTVLGCLPNAVGATKEFYDFLVAYYLPQRFPKMFVKQESSILNTVTERTLPISAPESPIDALRIIGGNLDEDFLVLMPSDDGDGYTLKAFVGCFPSGFDTSKKCGLKLRDIHIPVPRYKQRLEASMDRYFAKLETGKFVRRVNWSIATNAELFAAFKKTHVHEGDTGSANEEPELDLSNVYQRTELQTLFRLPVSQALIFVIKTYMYPLQQIKDEGLGETFAQAIEGLQTGNVPEMHIYKRGAVWGEKIKAFLRS